MGTDHHHKFAVLLAVLGTAFGENGMPKARAEIYYENLKDIPIPQLEGAVQTILKTRKYSSIPTIAEIREAALGRDDEIETAALESWGKANYFVSRSNYQACDELTNEAVRVAFGGWEKFGQTDPEDDMANRAHFLRVYKALARKRRELGEPALLPAGTHKEIGEGDHARRAPEDLYVGARR